VADGNFKADHVRQKNQVDDVWLSEGGGMIAKRDDYYTFLATAIERLTVSIILFYKVWQATQPLFGGCAGSALQTRTSGGTGFLASQIARSRRHFFSPFPCRSRDDKEKRQDSVTTSIGADISDDRHRRQDSRHPG
jgi:hypothetical protein